MSTTIQAVVSDRHAERIGALVESGEYTSVSEYVRTLVRQDLRHRADEEDE